MTRKENWRREKNFSLCYFCCLGFRFGSCQQCTGKVCFKDGLGVRFIKSFCQVIPFPKNTDIRHQRSLVWSKSLCFLKILRNTFLKPCSSFLILRPKRKVYQGIARGGLGYNMTTRFPKALFIYKQKRCKDDLCTFQNLVPY